MVPLLLLLLTVALILVLALLAWMLVSASRELRLIDGRVDRLDRIGDRTRGI